MLTLHLHTSSCRPVSTVHMHAAPSHCSGRALVASAVTVPSCQFGLLRCSGIRRLARPLSLKAADQDPAGIDTEAAAEQPESVGEPVDSPDSNGAETSYSVLMERFAAAVEEDYADTDFLRGFVDEAKAEFSTLEASVSSAQTAAETAQKEAESMQMQYLRLNADFENFRRRAATEKDAVGTRTKAKVIEDLLPVIDAFDAAAGQVKVETEGEKKIAESYQGLYAKLVEAFKKMGLEVVPGKGAAFDPNVHEAIMRAPSDDVPDGTVLQEFRKGFRIGSTLLRPAMVQVSFTENDGPAAEESSGEQAASGGLAEGEEILQEAIAEEEAGKA